MAQVFHVSSSSNRESILVHGLDWTRMGRANGVAGARRPEVDGVFLCRNEAEVDFFCRMGSRREPFDVWAVDDIDAAELVETPEGFVYLPTAIPADRVHLWQSERRPEPGADAGAATTAHRSTLTISLDDGRVLRGAAADEWVQQAPSPQTDGR